MFARLHVAELPRANRDTLLLAAFFGLIHVLYYWLGGIRFDVTGLKYEWQFLDPALLQNHLFESLWCLHSQPPLFNLYLGMVLKWAPSGYPAVFQATFVLLGFLLYLSIYRLLLRLQVSPVIAFTVSTAFVSTPSFILYEHWLFYSFPVAALLLYSALALNRFFRFGRARTCALFFALLMLVCGIRSSFHLAYLLVAVGTLWFACRSRRRSIILAATVPVLVIAAIYTKNEVLFGHFTSSTWMGMSLAKMYLPRAPSALDALRRDGAVSKIALISPFSPIESYPESVIAAPTTPFAAALRATRKSTGFPNYNHVGYITISDQYARDVLNVVIRDPAIVVRPMLRAWSIYTLPSSKYKYLPRQPIEPLLWWYERVVAGRLPIFMFAEQVHLIPLLGLPLMFSAGVWFVVTSKGQRSVADRATLFFMLCTIAYVGFVTNSLEIGENNRFRFETDPFYVVLTGLFCDDLRRRWLRCERVTYDASKTDLNRSARALGIPP